MLADRFLLGVVEAVVLPAMLVFLSHWFASAERGRANTFLILGNPVTLIWMSVVSGYLVAAVGYRWMFIIEGLPAIGWAFLFRPGRRRCSRPTPPARRVRPPHVQR